jgi:antitoxin ParD1/3/4
MMMAAVEKVSIALSPEMVAMLKGAVASGEYASASEVVREALREWNLRKAEIERLRKAWREGVESGPSRPLDFQEIKRRGRERLAQAKQG